MVVYLLLFSGLGKESPDVCGQRRGRGSEGADCRPDRAKQPTRVREWHPARRREPRDTCQASAAAPTTTIIIVVMRLFCSFDIAFKTAQCFNLNTDRF